MTRRPPPARCPALVPISPSWSTISALVGCSTPPCRPLVASTVQPPEIRQQVVYVGGAAAWRPASLCTPRGTVRTRHICRAAGTCLRRLPALSPQLHMPPLPRALCSSRSTAGRRPAPHAQADASLVPARTGACVGRTCFSPHRLPSCWIRLLLSPHDVPCPCPPARHLSTHPPSQTCPERSLPTPLPNEMIIHCCAVGYRGRGHLRLRLPGS